jgi:rhodanese-related sulfurtransferase
LTRSVREQNFRRCTDWKTVADIPGPAIDDFRDDNDPNTSLWDYGPDSEHVKEVVLSLLFNRRSIGPITLALFWQDALGDDMGLRVVNTPGHTPYVPGAHLHYELTNPQLGDYPRFALAVGKRGALIPLKRGDVRDLVEDAYVAGTLPTTGVHPHLQLEVNDLIAARFVTPSELIGQNVPVFDIRGLAMAPHIPNAIQSNSANLFKDLHSRRIGGNDVFVLYCEDASHSRVLARRARAQNYRPKTLIGGFTAWCAAGYTVAGPP